ncbi:MAG TPA: hypothetical protein VER75_01290 [Thermoleophilaceae bacterium]|nr:hypothetical protein [Thermoleophilaceae bacterium]
MRGCTVALVLVLVALVGMLAVMREAERGRQLDPLMPLGLVVPLALIGGFVAFYLREQKLRPGLDAGDEHDHKYLVGGAVLKYGCLLLVVVTAATAVIGLLQYLFVDRH